MSLSKRRIWLIKRKSYIQKNVKKNIKKHALKAARFIEKGLINAEESY